MLTILYTKLEGKLISYIIIFLTTQNNMPLTKKTVCEHYKKNIIDNIIYQTKVNI